MNRFQQKGHSGYDFTFQQLSGIIIDKAVRIEFSVFPIGGKLI